LYVRLAFVNVASIEAYFGLCNGRQFFIPSLILIDFPEQSWCIALSSLLSASIQFYFIKSFTNNKNKSKAYNNNNNNKQRVQYNECFPFQFIIYASWSTISGVVFPFSFFVVQARRCGSVPKKHLTCWKIIHWINKDT